MEDYFNELEKNYHAVDVSKLKTIREKLVYLRKHNTKFGPESVEIQTIDSPFNQTLGVVFEQGLEVAISVAESEIEIKVVKALNEDHLNAFTQSIINKLNATTI